MSSDNDEHYAPNKRRMFKFHNPASDGPCTCKALPQSHSATPSSHASTDPVVFRPFTPCFSDHCLVRADMNRLERIRQEKLAAERMRSDPEGLWEEQIKCAKDPEAVQDVDRWLWIRDQEVFDEDGEHIDTKEGFVTRS
ncbi:MAG: hypothetical protein Q9226_005518 [Calogaya cf. arnoldii]